MLFSCVLTECDNYSIWSSALSFSLDGKNKSGFVERSVSTPIDHDHVRKWNRFNSVVML